MNKNTASYLLVFLIIILILFVKLQPVYFHPVHPGLDPSWQSALAYAAGHNLLFGSDIVFTGGPFSGLYNRQFEVQTAYFLVSYSLAIIFYIAALFSYIATYRTTRLYCLFIILFLLLCLFSNDTILLVVPFLAAIYAVWIKGKSGYIISSTGFFLSGGITLAKFSVFPLALFCALVADIVLVSRRKLPFNSFCFVAGLIFVFLIAGQPLEQLPAFITSSLEVSSGYSSAMSLPVQLPDPFAWLIIAGLFVCLLVYEAIKGWRTGDRDALVAQVFIVSAYLFIAFKAGFVRHDLHMLIAWSALLMGLLAVFIARFQSHRLRPALGIMAFLALMPGPAAMYIVYGEIPFSSVAEFPDKAKNEILQLGRFIASPADWKETLVQKNVASMAKIKAERPLPQVKGTVDTISLRSSPMDLIIAQDRQFRNIRPIHLR